MVLKAGLEFSASSILQYHAIPKSPCLQGFSRFKCSLCITKCFPVKGKIKGQNQAVFRCSSDLKDGSDALENAHSV